MIDCLSCRFAHMVSPLAPSAGAQCRFNPPIAAIVGMDKLGQPVIITMYPPVQKGSFICSHYDKRESAAVQESQATVSLADVKPLAKLSGEGQTNGGH